MAIVLVVLVVTVLTAMVALVLTVRRVMAIWHAIPKSNADFGCDISAPAVVAPTLAPVLAFTRPVLATRPAPGATAWASPRSSV